MARQRLTHADSETEQAPKLKFTRDNIKEGLAIFKYVKPYKKHFIAGLVVIALSALTTMTFPKLLQELIDSVNPDKSAAGSGAELLNSKFSLVSHFSLSAGQIALVMLGLLCVQMVISYLRVYYFTYVGENAVADMRKEVYSKMITMNMDFFAKRRVGELSSRVVCGIL